MVVRLRQVVLWQYDPDTPEAVLRRHRRIAGWVVWLMCATAVLTISSVAELVILGPPSLLQLIVLVVATALGIFLLVPGTLAAFWIHEIEQTLAQRRTVLDSTRSMDRRVGMAAMKMVFWAAVIVLAIHYLPPHVPWPYTPP